MFLTTESQDLDLHQGKLAKVTLVRVYIISTMDFNIRNLSV